MHGWGLCLFKWARGLVASIHCRRYILNYLPSSAMPVTILYIQFYFTFLFCIRIFSFAYIRMLCLDPNHYSLFMVINVRRRSNWKGKQNHFLMLNYFRLRLSSQLIFVNNVIMGVSIHPSVHPSVRPSICLSIHQFVCPSVYALIHSFVHSYDHSFSSIN